MKKWMRVSQMKIRVLKDLTKSIKQKRKKTRSKIQKEKMKTIVMVQKDSKTWRRKKRKMKKLTKLRPQLKSKKSISWTCL